MSLSVQEKTVDVSDDDDDDDNVHDDNEDDEEGDEEESSNHYELWSTTSIYFLAFFPLVTLL